MVAAPARTTTPAPTTIAASTPRAATAVGGVPAGSRSRQAELQLGHRCTSAGLQHSGGAHDLSRCGNRPRFNFQEHASMLSAQAQERSAAASQHGECCWTGLTCVFSLGCWRIGGWLSRCHGSTGGLRASRGGGWQRRRGSFPLKVYLHRSAEGCLAGGCDVQQQRRDVCPPCRREAGMHFSCNNNINAGHAQLIFDRRKPVTTDGLVAGTAFLQFERQASWTTQHCARPCLQHRLLITTCPLASAAQTAMRAVLHLT